MRARPLIRRIAAPILSLLALSASCLAPAGATIAAGSAERGSPSTWLVGGYFVNTARPPPGDISDSLIELKGDRIGFVGRIGQRPIPKGDKQIDLRGKYVVPGFVDNLGTFGNQSQASAYLYFGVTAVATFPFPPGDPLRPSTDLTASPAPLALPGAHLDGVDDAGHRLDPGALRAEIATKVAQGVKILDAWYTITNDQLRTLSQVPAKGFGYTAELASSDYSQAINTVNSLLHTSRFFLGLAPPELRQAIARDPFNPALSAQLIAYYEGLDLSSKAVQSYADMLATGKAYLVPTMALDYYSQFSSKEAFSDWWDQQVQRYGIQGIPNPSDGVHGDPEPPLVPNPRKMTTLYALERVAAEHGARYLLASAASRYGTLPGVSYPIEMQLMADELGLTPRQVLAAATTNFDDAFGLHSVGAIKPGYEADVVILDKNPTVDVHNDQAIHAVIRNGRYLSRGGILSRVG